MPTTPTPDVLARSRAQWTTAAPTWDREGDVIAASTRAVTEALVGAANLTAGMRVLDVAGGTGDPAARLAAVVGPRGRIVSTDLTPAMLLGARRRLAGSAGAPVDLVATSAEALPFPADVFDVVVSRFGAMLFAEPAAGVREMVRVARRGGTIAVAVWGAPERNPYLSVPMAVVGRLATLPPPDPEAPGVFRLAAAGQLAGLFTSAGARKVDEDRRAFVMEGPSDLGRDEFWPFLLRVAAPMRAVVEALPEAVQREIAETVRAEVAPYFASGAMRFPAEMVVVRGAKNG